MTAVQAIEGQEWMAIRYGQERLEFEVRRTNQRPHTVRIHLDPMLGVWVSAPPHAEGTAIRAAVRRRARWVYRYLEGRRSNPDRERVISGEQVLYLGRRYMLKVLDERPAGVKLRAGRLEIRCPGRDPERVRAMRKRWYREHATEYLQKRVQALFNPGLHGVEAAQAFS
ncbi:M48 family metallopeptidase [bacterium]|nr:M48 family metallopeptidase [bacterium]